MLLLWAVGVFRSAASVLFVGAAVTVVAFMAKTCSALADGAGPWLGPRRIVLALALVAVPVVIDPRTSDPFNPAKFALLCVAAMTAAVLWSLGRIRTSRPLQSRCGLRWLVLGLVIWTALATVTSITPVVSLVGAYGSYDGLISTIAFALLFVLILESFELKHIYRLMMALWFGATGLVAFYGLFQLHDAVTSVGGRWDWLQWSSESFSVNTVWSTLGNPNHLGGFAAVLLPTGIALAVVAPSRRLKAFVGLVAVPLVAELIYTGTAGAWLASLAALVVLAAFLVPELRSHSKALLTGTAVSAVFVVVASLVLGPTGGLGRQLSSAFDLGGSSTANQRFGYWKAAVRMAADRPFTGVGPDAYPLLFPRYQDADFVRFNGPSLKVNGPHNMFMNTLSAAGIPALGLLGALVLGAGLHAVGAWRRFRNAEVGGPEPAEATARHGRLLVSGVAASLAGYVVQASFNVHQVGLAILFWALLGMLAVLARAAGVPDSLRPRRLLSSASTGAPDEDPEGGSSQSRWTGPRVASAAAITLAGAVLAAQAIRPYLADRKLYEGQRWQSTVREITNSGGDRRVSRIALIRARDNYLEASRRDPWEALFLQNLARSRYQLAQFTPRNDSQAKLRLGLLRKSRDDFRAALRLDVGSVRLLNEYAEVLIRLSEIDPPDPRAAQEAQVVLRQGIRANPWQPRSALVLSRLLEREGDLAGATAVGDRALAVSPKSPELLRQVAKLRGKAGDKAGARPLWERLLAVSPGDAEALDGLK